MYRHTYIYNILYCNCYVGVLFYLSAGCFIAEAENHFDISFASKARGFRVAVVNSRGLLGRFNGIFWELMKIP